MQYRKLWLSLIAVLVISFGILGYGGTRIASQAPPIPEQVVAADGTVLFDGASIRDGQNVWQSIGGQEIGSIWGHGAYVAPDWTADWLHRESTMVLDKWAQTQGAASWQALAAEQQAALQARLQAMMRTNSYDAASGRLTVANERAQAFNVLADYYGDIFKKGRDAYAIPANALTDQVKIRQMASFFFWTAWASTTARPGSDVSYTQNWPHEPLVGNRPSSGTIVWSVVSVVLLLAGIGAMVWFLGSREGEPHPIPPERNPFLGLTATPSQLAVVKYFFVVAALWLVQIVLGVVTAHYGVEGNGFYGIPLSVWLPYAITRTWHLQLGIFWIATAWLATGLFLAPAIGGAEPRGQKLGVNVLFAALVFVVVGSMIGEWFGIQQKLGNLWFWFGMQGYEYVELGRFWQILLFGGLVLWLWLMGRALLPALKRHDESRSLLVLFLISAIAIPMFYAAGLMYGQKTSIVIAEYWRWWVVHLWVEGFFEVFATVVIAFLFTRLGLLTVPSATRATLFSTTIFLSGGVIGTFHHLYFSGAPELVVALGSVFSALEVVPLVLVGFEAWENIRLSRPRGPITWMTRYRWPIRFFVAVAFWNFVGAGIFGFLINPPIALYYVQGLNLTPVHGHTALFGVYGMLALGLMLFTLRALWPRGAWRETPLAIGFWGINIGLALMVLLSVLPVGILQAWASVEVGTWYARSADFMQTDVMTWLRWLRVIGDVVFGIGAMAIGAFTVGLMTGHSFERTPDEVDVAPAMIP